MRGCVSIKKRKSLVILCLWLSTTLVFADPTVTKNSGSNQAVDHLLVTPVDDAQIPTRRRRKQEETTSTRGAVDHLLVTPVEDEHSIPTRQRLRRGDMQSATELSRPHDGSFDSLLSIIRTELPQAKVGGAKKIEDAISSTKFHWAGVSHDQQDELFNYLALLPPKFLVNLEVPDDIIARHFGSLREEQMNTLSDLRLRKVLKQVVQEKRFSPLQLQSHLTPRVLEKIAKSIFSADDLRGFIHGMSNSGVASPQADLLLKKMTPRLSPMQLSWLGRPELQHAWEIAATELDLPSIYNLMTRVPEARAMAIKAIPLLAPEKLNLKDWETLPKSYELIAPHLTTHQVHTLPIEKVSHLYKYLHPEIQALLAEDPDIFKEVIDEAFQRFNGGGNKKVDSAFFEQFSKNIPNELFGQIPVRYFDQPDFLNLFLTRLNELSNPTLFNIFKQRPEILRGLSIARLQNLLTSHEILWDANSIKDLFRVLTDSMKRDLGHAGVDLSRFAVHLDSEQMSIEEALRIANTGWDLLPQVEQNKLTRRLEAEFNVRWSHKQDVSHFPAHFIQSIQPYHINELEDDHIKRLASKLSNTQIAFLQWYKTKLNLAPYLSDQQINSLFHAWTSKHSHEVWSQDGTYSRYKIPDALWLNLSPNQVEKITPDKAKLVSYLGRNTLVHLPINTLLKHFKEGWPLPEDLLYLSDAQLQALSRDADAMEKIRHIVSSFEISPEQKDGYGKLNFPELINPTAFKPPFSLSPPWISISSIQLAKIGLNDLKAVVDKAIAEQLVNGRDREKKYHAVYRNFLRRLDPVKISSLTAREINEFGVLPDLSPDHLPMLPDTAVRDLSMKRVSSFFPNENQFKNLSKTEANKLREEQKLEQADILSRLVLRLTKDQLKDIPKGILLNHAHLVFPYLNPALREELGRSFSPNDLSGLDTSRLALSAGVVPYLPETLQKKFFERIDPALIPASLYTSHPEMVFKYLKPSQSKHIPVSLFSEQPDLVIKHLTPKHVDSLTQSQLSALPVSKLSLFNQEQFKKIPRSAAEKLSEAHKAALIARDSLFFSWWRFFRSSNNAQVPPPADGVLRDDVGDAVEMLHDVNLALHEPPLGQVCRVQEIGLPNRNDFNMGRVVSGLKVNGKIHAFSIDSVEDFQEKQREFMNGPGRAVKYETILDWFNKCSESGSPYHLDESVFVNILGANDLGEARHITRHEAQENIENLISEMNLPPELSRRGPSERAHRAEFAYELKQMIYNISQMPETHPRKVDFVQGLVRIMGGLFEDYCFEGKLSAAHSLAAQQVCNKNAKLPANFYEKALSGLDVLRNKAFKKRAEIQGDNQTMHTEMYYRDLIARDIAIPKNRNKDPYQVGARQLSRAEFLRGFFSKINSDKVAYTPWEIAKVVHPIFEKELQTDKEFVGDILRAKVKVEYPIAPKISIQDWAAKYSHTLPLDDEGLENWKFENWLMHQQSKSLNRVLLATGEHLSEESPSDEELFRMWSTVQNDSTLNRMLLEMKKDPGSVVEGLTEPDEMLEKKRDALNEALDKLDEGERLKKVHAFFERFIHPAKNEVGSPVELLKARATRDFVMKYIFLNDPSGAIRRGAYTDVLIPRHEKKPRFTEPVFRHVLIAMGVLEEIEETKPYHGLSLKDTLAHQRLGKATTHFVSNPESAPNEPRFEGQTALTAAIDDMFKTGRIEAVKTMLSHPRIDPNAPNANGQTPLMLSLAAQSPELLSELLGHPELDPYAADQWDILLSTVISNYPLLKKLALHPKTKRNEPHFNGKPALQFMIEQAAGPHKAEFVSIAKELGSRSDVDILLDIKNNNSPLQLALRTGQSEIVSGILRNPKLKESNVLNESHFNGKPALQFMIEEAARTHNPQIVSIAKELAGHSAVDIHLGSQRGASPLQLAVRTAQSEIASAILKNPKLSESHAIAVLLSSNDWDKLETFVSSREMKPWIDDRGVTHLHKIAAIKAPTNEDRKQKWEAVIKKLALDNGSIYAENWSAEPFKSNLPFIHLINGVKSSFESETAEEQIEKIKEWHSHFKSMIEEYHKLADEASNDLPLQRVYRQKANLLVQKNNSLMRQMQTKFPAEKFEGILEESNQ